MRRIRVKLFDVVRPLQEQNTLPANTVMSFVSFLPTESPRGTQQNKQASKAERADTEGVEEMRGEGTTADNAQPLTVV